MTDQGDRGGVSVIIPLYNKVETIARAIDSVLAQEVEFEILVVDDGSTDGSTSVAEAYGDTVKCIWQKNMGPSCARNRGAELSRFPHLVFLDADDELLPGCLAAHLECRRHRPDIRVSFSPSKRIQKFVSDSPGEFTRCGDHWFSSCYRFQLVASVHISWVCVNKDLFTSVGGFDPALRCWEITEFLYRLFVQSSAVGVLERAYVAVHKDPENSQFHRTRNDAAFRTRYLHKILDRIAEIPVDQRSPVLSKVRQSLKELIAMGAIGEYREILNRLVPLHQDKASLWKLQLLSLLPDPVIQTGVRAWRQWASDHGQPASQH